jgi:hypothetical protein
VGESLAGSRFQRGRGQATTEIRLVEPDDAQPGRDRVVTQPDKRQFIGYGEQRECVRRAVPVPDQIGVGDGELERRVNRLAGLGSWR